ncbi:DNA polymerase III subunit delta' [Pseudomonadota bacterium]
MPDTFDNFDPDNWPPHPRTNPFLTGHEDAEKTLLDSFFSDRMHHAWLITGPKGIGKATLAYKFARFVLNQGPVNAGPSLFGDALPATQPESLNIAEDNPVFTRVASGGHGDLLAIERRVNEKTGKLKTVIDVDSVRQVGQMMTQTSAEGGWRVVVIDSADEMNVNAANAVLKVLEEPPKNALLLLLSHNPGKLLPTIRSRCRKLALRPLPSQTVTDLVGRYAPDVGMDDALRLAELSDGSIGRALGLVEEGGLELYSELMALLHTLPNLDVTALHKLGDKVNRSGADDAFHTVTGLLRWWLERMILVASGKGSVGGADAAFMAQLAAQANLESWFLVWEKINHLVARTGAINLDKKQIVLDIFLGLQNTVRTAR